MPARDGTGPYGTGPVGRRFGPCGENVQEPAYNQPFGLGMAHRRGWRCGNRQPGRGWKGNTTYNSVDSEIQNLHNRENWLKDQLDAVSRQIESLGKTPE